MRHQRVVTRIQEDDISNNVWNRRWTPGIYDASHIRGDAHEQVKE